MNSDEHVGQLWWPDDIKAAFYAVTDILNCTRAFIGMVQAAKAVESEPYLDCFKKLRSASQRGRKQVGVIQDELRESHRELGEPLPNINGVTAAFAHGLIVEVGFGAMADYLEPGDRGTADGIQVLDLTPGSTPREEVMRMREQFQGLKLPCFSLLDLAGREAEHAARVRARVKNRDTLTAADVACAAEEHKRKPLTDIRDRDIRQMLDDVALHERWEKEGKPKAEIFVQSCKDAYKNGSAITAKDFPRLRERVRKNKGKYVTYTAAKLRQEIERRESKSSRGDL